MGSLCAPSQVALGCTLAAGRAILGGVSQRKEGAGRKGCQAVTGESSLFAVRNSQQVARLQCCAVLLLLLSSKGNNARSAAI